MVRLVEALDLSTLDKAVEGIKSGSIGDKVPNELKSYMVPGDGFSDVENYLKTADDMHADKTKTIQMAVKVAAHTDDPVYYFHLWSSRELCQNLAKYSQSSWLKSNEIYMGLSDKSVKYTRTQLEALRQFMRDESLNHGKNTKGSGAKRQNDVDVLYKDANWILLSPKSWDAEKRIAFFTNAQGEKEKCHWCTASGDSNQWYNTYTYSNTKPLYVMINKNDQAWQLAYYPTGGRVEFLNQFDRKDSFTEGDWMDELPIEMQEKIVNTFNGKSLADYTRMLRDRVIDDDNAPFEVSFLPWIKISGELQRNKADFNDFMIKDIKNKPLKSNLNLFIRLRTKPELKIGFTITNKGPELIDGLSGFNLMEKRVLRLALLQYASEVMDLSVDYSDKFDAALNELKANTHL